MSSWVVYVIVAVIYFILTAKKQEKPSNTGGKSSNDGSINEGNVINGGVENSGKTQTSLKEEYARKKAQEEEENSTFGQGKSIEVEGQADRYMKKKKPAPVDGPGKGPRSKETIFSEYERETKTHYSEESLVEEYKRTHGKGKTIKHHGHGPKEKQQAFQRTIKKKTNSPIARKLFKTHHDILRSFLAKELLDKKDF